MISLSINNILNQYIIPSLFTLLLLCLPLNVGPTIEYVLIILMIIVCTYNISTSGYSIIWYIKKFFRQPLGWSIGLFVISCGFSIITSIDPSYSSRQYIDEIILKIFFYCVFSIYCATLTKKTDWFKLIVIANIIFLVIYIYVMMQWMLMPTHPVFVPKGLNISHWNLQDIIFQYGNITTLIHDSKHTGFFLMLAIAVSCIPALWHPEKKVYFMLFLLNFTVLITTVRRSHMIASIAGIALSSTFKPATLKKLSLVITITIATLFLTGIYLHKSNKLSYLVHEDWNKVISWKVEQDGSVFLRLIAVKLYGAEVLKHPFTGVGLGKKNIKEAYPEIASKLKLGHPHNVFVNIACETGIQGALTLLLLICVQANLLFKCYKTTSNEDIQLIMITGLSYMLMYWLAQMATYGFRHGTATLYWLFMAIPTGYALAEQMKPAKDAG